MRDCLRSEKAYKITFYTIMSQISVLGAYIFIFPLFPDLLYMFKSPWSP